MCVSKCACAVCVSERERVVGVRGENFFDSFQKRKDENSGKGSYTRESMKLLQQKRKEENASAHIFSLHGKSIFQIVLHLYNDSQLNNINIYCVWLRHFS